MGSKIHYLVILLRKFIISHQKALNNAFKFFLTVFTIISFVPLFYDKWRDACWNFIVNIVHQMPAFLAYFYDNRAFILYTILVFLWISVTYYKHEVRFLQLAVDNKRELAMELPKIRSGCPHNHFLGLIIGELGEKALMVKEKKSTDIISSIDKNIKKYERVYWIAEDKIGIIFYEAVGKPWGDFLQVIKKKLAIEIGAEDSDQFLNDTLFEMVEIDLAKEELLYDIEGKAKTVLLKKKLEIAKAVEAARVSEQANKRSL